MRYIFDTQNLSSVNDIDLQNIIADLTKELKRREMKEKEEAAKAFIAAFDKLKALGVNLTYCDDPWDDDRYIELRDSTGFNIELRDSTGFSFVF